MYAVICVVMEHEINATFVDNDIDLSLETDNAKN